MDRVEAGGLTPEAERAVEDGDFRRARRASGGAAAAFYHFASRQSRRYAFERITDACCDCGRSAEGQAVRAEWDYRFPSVAASTMEGLAALGHVHVDRHRHGTFWTFHPVCRRCMRRWWTCRVAGTIVLVPAILGLALGLAMAVLGSIFYFGGTFSPGDRRLVGAAIPLFFAAAVLGAGLWRLGNWLRIPPPLRRVARPPIELKRMKRRPVTEWRELTSGREAAERGD